MPMKSWLSWLWSALGAALAFVFAAWMSLDVVGLIIPALTVATAWFLFREKSTRPTTN
jgi:hypothetical protein